jgi:putative methyltransferase (TIGR04325 family)
LTIYKLVEALVGKKEESRIAMESLYIGKFQTNEAMETFYNQLLKNSPIQPYDSSRWMLRQEAMLQDAILGKIPKKYNISKIDFTDICNVIDFGGGSGWLFHLLNREIENRLIRFNIIEREETKRYFESKYKSEKVNYFLRSDFIASNSSQHGNETIFYSNSVIQYILFDAEYTEIINTVKPKYLMFEDIYWTDTDNFFALQKYYGDYLKLLFRNLNDFKKLICSLGYIVAQEFPYQQTISRNFKSEVETINGDIHPIKPHLTIIFEQCASNSF